MTGLDVITVRDSARGDGIQDDAPAFRQAIAAATAMGGAIVFVDYGTYKLGSAVTVPATVAVMVSAGATFTGPGLLSAAGGLIVDYRGGALTAPVVDKGGQVFNVLAYGATVNGSSQQTYFQAANDAALAAGGGTVYIPPGTFNFDGTFVLGDAAGSYTGIGLVGDSLQTTILKWNGANSGVLCKADGLKNCNIGGFTLQCSTARVADVQTLTVIGGPTGTFKLVYGGSSGRPIGPTDTAAQVQAAIEAIGSIGVGQVLCAGGPLGTNPVTITLRGYLIGTTTNNFTLDLALLTGTSPTVTRTTTGSAMTGLWLQRHTGSGTQIGSLNLRNLGAQLFDIGVLGGNSALNQATSELNFDHVSFKTNGIGAIFNNFNTLDFHFTELELGANNIGLCMGGGSGNISVVGGSASASGSDFAVAGSNSGTFSVRNFRSENAVRMMTTSAAGVSVGVLISGCLIKQSINGPSQPMIYMDGGRLSVLNSWIDGQIVGRTNRGMLSVTLIDSTILDTVPFRLSTGYFGQVADTIQWATYNVVNCQSNSYPSTRVGWHFPDQVGMVLQGTNTLLPLLSITTQTSGMLPNLYLGGSAQGGWSAGPMYGGLQVSKIPNPTGTLSASMTGGTLGSTTYSYYIVAIDANGNKTLAGPTNTITNGAAFNLFDATHYVNLQWPAPGSFSAVAFDVIRLAGGTTQGAIALNYPYLAIQDTGLAATVYVNPTRNGTADVAVDGWLGVNGVAPVAPPALPIAAVDATTTQALANAIRTALIGTGITT
jgi:hypothetical protein